MESELTASPRAYAGAELITFGGLSSQITVFLKGVVMLWAGILGAAAFWMAWNGSTYLLPFVLIAGSSLIPLWFWSAQPTFGLPFLLFFVIQQGVIYMMPLFVENPSLAAFTPEVIRSGALAIALFFCIISLGWKSGLQMASALPSRWNISGEDQENTVLLAMRVSLFLLGFSVIGEMIPFLVNLGGFLPILTAGFNAASVLGALLGGYSMGVSGRHSIPYWIAIGLLFFISIHDVLLSAAEAFTLASILGLTLGSKKVPWKILLIFLSIISFLSLGKFTMRDRYWISSNSTGIPLTGLPAFYGEWGEASLAALTGQTDQAIETARQIKESNRGAFGERVNSFQNIAFVTRALSERGLEPLKGATYSLIPPLFIPRIFWPDKPRAHAGQDLLNIHFERQSAADVERTFVAWGLLPEAIGNFGLWVGPLFLGIVMGYILGFLETWSLQKQLFSIEGLILMGLWLQVLISFEMVSSVLLTSTFQMLVVIALGGVLLRRVFGARGEVEE